MDTKISDSASHSIRYARINSMISYNLQCTYTLCIVIMIVLTRSNDISLA